MAIDLQSLSITSAFNSIINYFRSQENNSAWRDFSNSSEGSFICRLLANVMSVISYRVVAQSRENYLSTAALPASNIGIAVNLGYSVPRGSNLKRLIRLIPNGNYTLPKLSVIGSYNSEYNILNLNEETLVEGQPINIETVVGNLREESFTTGTSDIKIFTLFNSKISDDYILYKDTEIVPTTNVIKEMLDDKYLVRTNPYSSVDIMYLNTFESAKYKYGNGTEMTVRFVELADVPVIPYTSSMFTYGTLDDYRTIQGNRGMETVESMKVTAPLYHEVQNLIRSKADYASALRINVPSVTEVNFRALTPTYTQISYLKDKFNLLTGTYLPVGSSSENKEVLASTEVQNFLDLLRDQNYFGTPLPDITPPQKEEASLSIFIALKNKYKSIADINLDIQNILDNYYDTYLNVTFSTYELERQIEALSYVKYARVEHKKYERAANEFYQLGYMTYDEKTGNYYKISGMTGIPSSVSNNNLDWASKIKVGNDIDTNAVIKDGSVYWKCYKRLNDFYKFNVNNRVSGRDSNVRYKIGDFIRVDTESLKGLMFKCIDVERSSGTIIPDVTTSELGDFIEDGGLVWVVIERVSDPSIPTWVSGKSYRVGQRVNGTGDNFSLECVGYAGCVSSFTTPTFFQDSLDILGTSVTGEPSLGNVRRFFFVNSDNAIYFQKGDSIKAYYNEGPTTKEVLLEVVSSFDIADRTRVEFVFSGTPLDDIGVLEGGTVEPVPRGTIDDQVVWELVDDPTKVQYGWNSYVTFKYELEIVEG